MSERINRVVVVGASIAGVQTTESLRRLGYDGTIVLLDSDKELPYNRPPLSKEFVAGDLDEDDIRLLSPDQLNELDVDLRLGVTARALSISERVVETSSGAVEYDRLVIATGAVPILPEDWARLDGVTALRNLDDARYIRAALVGSPQIVVVGGGFLGCEIAASLRRMGAAVSLVVSAPTLMARALAAELAAPVARLHEESGIDVHYGSPVAGLIGSKRVTAVELEDGRRLEADLVIAGIGARPATDWLASSGMTIADGVRTDNTLCAAPGVYAAGDIARYDDSTSVLGLRMEHWTSAREHGMTVAANLLDAARATPVSGLPFVWSDQHGRRIQIVGNAVGKKVVFADTDDDGSYLAFVGDSTRVTGVAGFDRPRQFRAGRKLLENSRSWQAIDSVQL